MAGHMQQRGESTWRLQAFIGHDRSGKRSDSQGTLTAAPPLVKNADDLP